MRPRALFIAYLYPPTGGNSPRMTFHYARALSRAGYEVDVVTPRPSRDHLVYRPDDSWSSAGLEGVQIHHTYPGPLYRLASLNLAARNVAAAPAARAARMAQVRRWYRLLVRPWVLPDTRADWLPWALRRAGRLLAARRYDLLFTFGFPFTSHVAGLALHVRRPLPWVAHNGDVWSFQPGNGMPAWRRSVDRTIEHAVLRRTRRLIVNTAASAEAYARRFPEVPRERFAVIPTGYDRTLYDRPGAETGAGFRLVYTGTIAESARAGPALVEALGRVRARGQRNVQCVIAGEVPQSLQNLAQRLGLAGALEFRGFQPMSAVASLQKSASVLVVFGMPGGLQVPCKLLEYLAARRPVLVIASEPDDVAAREVMRLRRGMVVSERPAEICAAISCLAERWSEGTLDGRFDLSGIPALSWEDVEERFVEIVDAARRSIRA